MSQDADVAGTGGWLRLDPRMLAVAPVHEVVRFIPLLIAAVIAGGRGDRQWWLLSALGAVVGLGVLRWVTTRYRVTPQRLELRSGLLFRQHRSVPRDRIRTVDVTARPLHRMFRLGVLRIGTGQHERGRNGELTLDAVSIAEAERLRTALLDRGTATITPTSTAQAPAEEGIELARLSWSWLRFAPLTVLAVGSVGVLFGGVWQLLDEAGVDVTDIGVVRDAVDWLTGRPVGVVVVATAAVLLATGAIGAVVLYIEAWWGYRLTREPDGTLRVSRGLLTRRSVSLEERRLRGVEVSEPLLLRAGRGARLSALATGSGSGQRGADRSALLPPAPRAVAHQVAAAVLHRPATEPPTTRPLRRHPPAALRRRLVRAVVPAALLVLGLATAAANGALPSWPAVIVAAILLPSAVLLALDRYRNLGHAVAGEHLLVRGGSLVRRTVALRRSGIIGWRVSRSVFQRAAGVASATAVTAAGAGAYEVRDCDLTAAGGLVSRNHY
ncbi:MAG TPA: PH domain-containing protein [Pseudonocardiaceae bacterium]